MYADGIFRVELIAGPKKIAYTLDAPKEPGIGIWERRRPGICGTVTFGGFFLSGLIAVLLGISEKA
jgi:hypothetical protein